MECGAAGHQYVHKGLLAASTTGLKCGLEVSVTLKSGSLRPQRLHNVELKMRCIARQFYLTAQSM